MARVYDLFIRKKREHIMSVALKTGSLGAKKKCCKTSNIAVLTETYNHNTFLNLITFLSFKMS